MPTQRFFNLPESKRQAFIDAALEEFGTNSYDSASVSKIVKNLKIAKGSVYQYFENKKEIYFYLIDYIREERIALIEQAIQDSDGDFFETYMAIFQASLEFDYKYPLECLFLAKITREWNHPELGPVHVLVRRDIIKQVEKLIRESIKQGALRDDNDPHLMAFLLVNSTLNIYDYDAVKNNSASIQSDDGEVGMTLSKRKSQNIAKQIIDVFKHGFLK